MSPLKFHFITVIIVPVRIPLRSVTGSRFQFIYGKKLHGPGPQHCLWLRMRQVLLTGAKPPSPSSSSLDSLSLAEKKTILRFGVQSNLVDPNTVCIQQCWGSERFFLDSDPVLQTNSDSDSAPFGSGSEQVRIRTRM